jgi:hypothetical protein
MLALGLAGLSAAWVKLAIRATTNIAAISVHVFIVAPSHRNIAR